MFQKKRNINKKIAVDVENIGTVISVNTSLEGAILKGTECVRIDGSFKGDINLEGTLVLGETGKIEGSVNVTHFIVAGSVIGNIECSGQLHFASTANVTGDIRASSLIVDDGAQLDGKYKVIEVDSKSDTHWDQEGEDKNESTGQD